MEYDFRETMKLVFFRLIPCFLFIISGTIGFFFFAWSSNWNASFWSLNLETSCTVVFHMNYHYLQQKLHLKYDVRTLLFHKISSIIFLAISFACGVTYVALGITKEQVFCVEGAGYYASAVAAFLTCVWSGIWLWDARKYEILLA
ncbi:hypothetical protein X975_26158, partial [Stegodyphus mimosarum]